MAVDYAPYLRELAPALRVDVGVRAGLLGLGTPDLDANAQYVSIAVDGSAITVGSLNTVAVDGWSEGMVWDLGSILDYLPEFDASRGDSIRVYGDDPTPGLPATVAPWIGLALLETPVSTAVDGVGMVMHREAAGAYKLASQSATTWTLLSGLNSHEMRGMFLSVNADGVYISAPQGAFGVGSVGDSSMTVPARLCLVAGCDSATADGTSLITAKTLKIALVQGTP